MAMYEPLAQADLAWFPGAYIIRGSAAATLAPQATRIIRELSPDQPVERIATLDQIREETLAPQRLNAMLIGMLGILALVIAAVGIGGVLAFFVSQRTTEIGIRMSLGAAPTQVVRMVLSDGGLLLGVGIILGLVGSILPQRLLRGLLFDVAPQDPVTFTMVALSVICVGVGACALPALRAARIDPLVAMRTE
jgi:ABC-type antimicrobial peptide transport system permease subunit